MCALFLFFMFQALFFSDSHIQPAITTTTATTGTVNPRKRLFEAIDETPIAAPASSKKVAARDSSSSSDSDSDSDMYDSDIELVDPTTAPPPTKRAKPSTEPLVPPPPPMLPVTVTPVVVAASSPPAPEPIAIVLAPEVPVVIPEPPPPAQPAAASSSSSVLRDGWEGLHRQLQERHVAILDWPAIKVSPYVAWVVSSRPGVPGHVIRQGTWFGSDVNLQCYTNPAEADAVLGDIMHVLQAAEQLPFPTLPYQTCFFAHKIHN